MPFLGRALVGNPLLVERNAGSEAALAPGQRPFAVERHGEEFQHAPVRRPGEMGHELAHPALFVRVVGQVDLVDDVDQVMEFGDAPEHPVDAEPRLPLAVAELAEQQEVGLAQVGVGPVGVRAVVAVMRCQRNTSAVLVFDIERGLGGKAQAPVALALMGRFVGEPAAFHGDAARELGFYLACFGGGGAGEDGAGDAQHRTDGAISGTNACQRHTLPASRPPTFDVLRS